MGGYILYKLGKPQKFTYNFAHIFLETRIVSVTLFKNSYIDCYTHFVLAHKNRIIFCLYNLYVHRMVDISYKNAMIKKKLNILGS